jgi:carbon-monoxide dehydrogenase medium subunit
VVISEQREIADCRIALASLGPTPFRAFASEELLRGQMPTEAALAAAAEAAGGEAKPIGDMRASASYRTTLAKVLTLRALREAVQCASAEVAA